MAEYNDGVLIGDWYEKIQQKQEVLNTYIRRKEKNLLLTQKTNAVKKNLLREVPLHVQPDGILRYGDTVQIVNPELKVALSNVIQFQDVFNIQNLAAGCVLSGSFDHTPCVRNVFRLVSMVPSDNEPKPLRFGDDFLLETLHDGSVPLYVQSEIPNMNFDTGITNHRKVKLTATRNTYCRWSILAYKKTEREDLLNCVVQANVPVRINHSASNQQLAVEPRLYDTLFDAMEHEITVHTYMDIHRFEKIENAWILFTPPPPRVKPEDSTLQHTDDQLSNE
ncbi:hypothetical protein WDU94_015115 [Cyamophila willieti]